MNKLREISQEEESQLANFKKELDKGRDGKTLSALEFESQFDALQDKWLTNFIIN